MLVDQMHERCFDGLKNTPVHLNLIWLSTDRFFQLEVITTNLENDDRMVEQEPMLHHDQIRDPFTPPSCPIHFVAYE